ncbi:helix-turn-helix transcriptional regulator [Ensifer sp. NM-2]|uniref:helix-turn-helix transcriptional regulator n=1 Tax=Ensifer sp. NM-2 TaxID=2109730 RepID=UPI001FE1C6D3|nr:helix-turn-helix transcriptional regulator [Ensifer sp. NM-2]
MNKPPSPKSPPTGTIKAADFARYLARSALERHGTQVKIETRPDSSPPTISSMASQLKKAIRDSEENPAYTGYLEDSLPIVATKQPPAARSILTPADLGQLVRKAREDMKLSQQQFADLAGVGRRFISELENGKQTLEFGKALKVAHAAGITLFGNPR